MFYSHFNISFVIDAKRFFGVFFLSTVFWDRVNEITSSKAKPINTWIDFYSEISCFQRFKEPAKNKNIHFLVMIFYGNISKKWTIMNFVRQNENQTKNDFFVLWNLWQDPYRIFWNISKGFILFLLHCYPENKGQSRNRKSYYLRYRVWICVWAKSKKVFHQSRQYQP